MEPKVQNECRKIIANHLREIGVQMNVVGYRYLKEAIFLVVEDPSRSAKKMYQLYELVAEKYGTSKNKVQFGIARILNNTIERGDWAVIEKYFSDLNPNNGKPTIKHFINTVANKVLDDLKEINFL